MSSVPIVVCQRCCFQPAVMSIYFCVCALLQTAIVEARQSEEHLEIHKNTIESIYSPPVRKASEEFSRRFFSLIHSPTPDRVSFRCLFTDVDIDLTEAVKQEMREIHLTSHLRGLKFPIYDFGSDTAAFHFYREYNKKAIGEYLSLLRSIETQSSLSRPTLIRIQEDPLLQPEDEGINGIMMDFNLIGGPGARIVTLIPAIQISALSRDTDYDRIELLKALYNTGLVLLDSKFLNEFGHSSAVSSLVLARYLRDKKLIDDTQLSHFLEHAKNNVPKDVTVVFRERLELQRQLVKVRLEKLFSGDLSLEQYVPMLGVDRRTFGSKYHFYQNELIGWLGDQDRLENCNREDVFKRVDDFFSCAQNGIKLRNVDSIQESLNKVVWFKDEFDTEDWLVALATEKTRAFFVTIIKEHENLLLTLQASLDITELTYLARKFYTENGRFPTSQKELEVGHKDPFNGEDYSFKMKRDSLIIYSVGWKGIDNAGEMDPKLEFEFFWDVLNPTMPGVGDPEESDIGWELKPDR